MKRGFFVGLAAVSLLGAVQAPREMPIFQVDPAFFTPLPNGWITGQGSAVAVDRRDHVWVFHRPRYVAADQKAAPPVLEFGPRLAHRQRAPGARRPRRQGPALGQHDPEVHEQG
jgi:hypothetical protein